MNKNCVTVRMAVKDYARLIGHSESYVRRYCFPGKIIKGNERIELCVPFDIFLEGCHRLSVIK